MNISWKNKNNKNNKDYKNITIAYLSWHRENILEQTLKSHKDNGLFDLITNKVILFQEITNLDVEIAKKFNIDYIGEKDNIGILSAFVKLLNNCKTEYFIFSENDWKLVHDKDYTKKVIDDCLDILKENKASIIRLRSKNNPGQPYSSLDEWMFFNWINKNINNFPWKSESLSWIPPNVYTPGTFESINKNFKWDITNFTHQEWSNNIFIAKTSFLKETILPIIECMKNDNLAQNKYLGLEAILYKMKELKNDHPEKNKINKFLESKIASGVGLFTHKDRI
jgi:hypothetical protein